MAQRLLDTVARPYTVDGFQLDIFASVGVFLDHQSYDKAEDVLRAADIAMYRAKSQGRGQYVVFDASLGQEVTTYLTLEHELREALKRGELCAHYQPILTLEGERIRGVEALVRWDHPEKGLISPGTFLPVAEACGLTTEIDLLVLRQAAQQVAAWNEAFGTALEVSVNLSGQHFRDASIVENVANILEETRLAPHLLNLELTETILVSRKQTSLSALHQLKALGVNLHLDDFGTGYSSLSYLQDFPIDTLKIDRSFVSKVVGDERSVRLIGSIIAMARVLGLAVVAEGIEEREQVTILRDLACESVQGYFFAKPGDAEATEALLLGSVTSGAPVPG